MASLLGGYALASSPDNGLVYVSYHCCIYLAASYELPLFCQHALAARHSAARANTSDCQCRPSEVRNARPGSLIHARLLARPPLASRHVDAKTRAQANRQRSRPREDRPGTHVPCDQGRALSKWGAPQLLLPPVGDASHEPMPILCSFIKNAARPPLFVVVLVPSTTAFTTSWLLTGIQLPLTRS